LMLAFGRCHKLSAVNTGPSKLDKSDSRESGRKPPFAFWIYATDIEASTKILLTA
jgi:hypothetical protein